MDNRMNIAFACNKDYVKYAEIMMQSLFVNNKKSIKIYVLVEGNLGIQKDKLYDVAKRYDSDISFIQLLENTRENDIKKITGGGTIYIDRWWALELLPEDVDRFLLLDVDIIVKGDLWKFYNSDFEDKYLILCRDMGVIGHLGDKEVKKWINFLQKHYIKEVDKEYGNLGVALVNRKMKEVFDWNHMINTIIQNRYIFLEQDYFNINMRNYIKVVDSYEYNYTAHIGDFEKNIDKVKILHYAGPKPWHGEGAIWDKPWYDYARKTIGCEDIVREYERRRYISWENQFRNCELLHRWMDVRAKESTVFDKCEYSSVALYGAGRMCRHLLNDLKSANIPCRGIYDRNSELNEVEGWHVSHNLEKFLKDIGNTDVIIVTAVAYYDEIKDLLGEKTDIRIVSLEEIVTGKYGECSFSWLIWNPS